ncbi:MAG: YgiT-type zinc finger protein [Anaerolineae bacterium]
MRCVVCLSPNIEKKKINETLWIDSDVILIPIEVMACNNCGERYYDRRTMRRLEEIEKSLRERRLNLNPVGKVLEVVTET